MMSTPQPSTFLEGILAETGIRQHGSPLGLDIVTATLRQHYGLVGDLHRIATEKDDTFRLQTSDDRTFLVKCSPNDEPLDIVDLQTKAMVYLEETYPELPVQRVVRTVDGERSVILRAGDTRPRLLRVLSYLPGRLLNDVARTPEQWRLAGQMLGRLTTAMEGFAHLRDRRLLLWDMDNFHRLDELLEFVTDVAHRRLADEIFTAYNAVVTPALHRLERQVIHGDFSPYNAVADAADPRLVTGIIDFGDTVRTCALFDVAVGMANLIGSDASDPWRTATEFLRGYRCTRSLHDDDVQLLREIALGRLLLRAMVVYWRATTDPTRHTYLLTHAGQDWSCLEAAWAVPADDVRTALHATAPAANAALEDSQ